VGGRGLAGEEEEGAGEEEGRGGEALAVVEAKERADKERVAKARAAKEQGQQAAKQAMAEREGLKNLGAGLNGTWIQVPHAVFPEEVEPEVRGFAS